VEGLGDLYRYNIDYYGQLVIDESSEIRIYVRGSIVRIAVAALTYFILMFTTIFSWFVLGQHMVNVMATLGAAVAMAEVTTVTQNCILATNVTFIALLIIWTVWFAYVAHSSEYEQTYRTRRY